MVRHPLLIIIAQWFQMGDVGHDVREDGDGFLGVKFPRWHRPPPKKYCGRKTLTLQERGAKDVVITKKVTKPHLMEKGEGQDDNHKRPSLHFNDETAFIKMECRPSVELLRADRKGY
nr:putative integron gene cassette protein [uncultured bacterium]